MEELLFYLSLFIFVILACIIVVARFSKPAPARDSSDEYEIINFETMLLPLEFSSSSNDQLAQAVAKMFEHYDELAMTTTQKRFLPSHALASTQMSKQISCYKRLMI